MFGMKTSMKTWLIITNIALALATCENADSGKAIEWPLALLTLNGSFAGLPQGRR